jgi:hypothetical protein
MWIDISEYRIDIFTDLIYSVKRNNLLVYVNKKFYTRILKHIYMENPIQSQLSMEKKGENLRNAV